MNRQQRIGVIVVFVGMVIYFLTSSTPEAPDTGASPVAVETPATPAPSASPTGPRPNEVLIAMRDLDPATMSALTTADVSSKIMPDSIFIPAEAVRTFKEVESKVLASRIFEGEVLVKNRFEEKQEVVERVLRNYIDKEHRAISLQVDAVSGTTGFISQGDFVDVVAIYDSAGRRFSRIILENVEVLAKGNEYFPRQDRAPQSRIAGDAGTTYFTLKVDPEMAVRLAHLVDRRGVNQFRLLLRNRDDKEHVETRGVLLSEIISGVPRPPIDDELEAGEGIEIMRGQAIDRTGIDEESSTVAGAGEESEQGFEEGEFGSQLPQGEEGSGGSTTETAQPPPGYRP